MALAMARRALQLMSVGLVCATAGAVEAEQALPIRDILSNPSAYHRQAVVLHGVVEMPGEMRGVNAWGQQLCGQQFMLNDETGQLPVRTMVVCQQGSENSWRVGHGESVTVEATMEAAPGNMKTISGRGLGVSAVANRVIHEFTGSPQVSIAPMR